MMDPQNPQQIPQQLQQLMSMYQGPGISGIKPTPPGQAMNPWAGGMDPSQRAAFEQLLQGFQQNKPTGPGGAPDGVMPTDGRGYMGSQIKPQGLQVGEMDRHGYQVGTPGYVSPDMRDMMMWQERNNAR